MKEKAKKKKKQSNKNPLLVGSPKCWKSFSASLFHIFPQRENVHCMCFSLSIVLKVRCWWWSLTLKNNKPQRLLKFVCGFNVCVCFLLFFPRALHYPMRNDHHALFILHSSGLVFSLSLSFCMTFLCECAGGLWNKSDNDQREKQTEKKKKKKRSSFTLYGQKIWGELWPVHACENVPLDPAQARTKRVKNLHSNSITSSVFFFAKRRRRERETNGENVCLRLHVLFSLLSGRSLCIPTIYLYSPSSSSNSKTPQNFHRLSSKLTDMSAQAGQRSDNARPTDRLWCDGANGRIDEAFRINQMTHSTDFVHMWCTNPTGRGGGTVSALNIF